MISLGYFAETSLVVRLAIVRVLTLREDAIDSIDSLRFSGVTYLTRLVIIDLSIRCHGHSPSGYIITHK